MRLFLAGPFFTEEEAGRLDKVKTALEKLGYEVYSTSHRNNRINLNSAVEKTIRFRLLCEEISKSDGVFAVLDGKDAGTIWEMGYAFAIGKPVIAFIERDPYFSLMIDRSSAYLVGFENITEKIADHLKNDIDQTPKLGIYTIDDY
ncbi:nucleoside 2-deoxyribosyltransferase [Methanocella sp. CWC-04]|uniref:Nucleoside 2-deoxyribosyltransferase n=1 Tax=Methanooceanicella nereidis TaxID=2052831 RepID=A0AAP2RDC6_9EURY|nr:nucleoside 2-deoxyribosyltransferase [Methanocella sp. CWC-04]MCD1295413.1 nucleoside 2-deoxyribosyltransferase [Methanocella sp. CWC-04]